MKVQNIGPSTRGAVFVEGSDLTTRYPIELPTGSSKAASMRNRFTEISLVDRADLCPGEYRGPSVRESF